MKEINRKGFTLAELLIVVAIIAVLVAIAIPVFAGRLEKAREATCMANRRSLYGQVVTEHIVSDIPYKELFDIYVSSAGKCPSGGVFSWEDQGDTGVVICSYHDGGGGGSESGSESGSGLHATPGITETTFTRGAVIKDATGTAVVLQGMNATWKAYSEGKKTVAELASEFSSDIVILNAGIKDSQNIGDYQPHDVYYDSSTNTYRYVDAVNVYEGVPNKSWVELNQ